MNILSWIIFGALAGGVAYLLERTNLNGLISNIILGVLGALLGGFLANIFLNTNIERFNISSFIIAILGSLLLIFIQKAFASKN